MGCRPSPFNPGNPLKPTTDGGSGLVVAFLICLLVAYASTVTAAGIVLVAEESS